MSEQSSAAAKEFAALWPGRAELVSAPGTWGVNVWRAKSRSRVAWDTVWFNLRTISWGPRFEHTLPTGTPVEEVVAAVKRTTDRETAK